MLKRVCPAEVSARHRGGESVPPLTGFSELPGSKRNRATSR